MAIDPSSDIHQPRFPNQKLSSPSSSTSGDIAPHDPVEDQDALRLAASGYTPQISRKYTLLSILGTGFSLTNSWFGISTALVTGFSSGGPVSVIYGLVLLLIVSLCVGTSLSELASAMPNAGGQYYWTSKLAPPRHAPFAAYLTGALAWGGALFTSAAVCLAVAAAIMGCVAMSLPGFVVQSWQVVVIYQAVNAIAYLFNCCGRLLPSIGAIMLYTSLVSFVIITIVVPARTHNQNTATSVFATFINSTGWRSDGIAFIVGLVNSNWAFACLDCATHLAEEVHQPERMIPWAIMGTVVIGFVTGWTFSLAMFFSMGDATELANSSVPILQLFYQALRDTRGAIALESLVIATGFGCLIASHTWQARLAWSFARDRGLPGSRHWASVNTRLDSPIAAHSLSCVVVALLGFLYIGSTTAFNSMITACIVLLYVSYSIPVGYLVFYYGRSNLKRGPFWLGKLGMVANCVLLAWTVFTLVMYSLPYQLPATPGSMNYVSAVYVVVVCLVVGYWRVRGRHTFRIRSDQSAAVQESVTEQAGGASAFEEKHV